MLAVHGCNAPLRIDLIGVNALHATARDYPSDAQDVRLRAALRADAREQAELLLWEVDRCCAAARRRRRLSRPDHAIGDHA